jgi:shikimate 5-dehydrogenase
MDAARDSGVKRWISGLGMAVALAVAVTRAWKRS